MGYNLIMLGTGNAMVTKCYNTCFAIEKNGQYFLVDAGGGNGILCQMEKAKISFQKIHDMFVTHGHTDHVLGVIWVIRKIASLMENGKYEGEFRIYCHDKVKEMLEVFCKMTLVTKFQKYIGDRVQILMIEDRQEIQIDRVPMKITVFDILSTKAKQYGFRADFMDGTVLTCLGDEPYNKACYEVVKGSTWLLSEAFCLYEERDQFKPYEKHHSTALDAGKLAEELETENLLLYHTEDKGLSKRKETYTKEAKQSFRGNVFVPDDLETIKL